MAIEAGDPIPSHFIPLTRDPAMIINPHNMLILGGTSFSSPSPIPSAPLPLSAAADSGLTTTNNNNFIIPPHLPSSSRKRPRDVCSPFPNHSPSVAPFGCPSHRINMFTSPWSEQEASLLQMHHRELDSLISQHTQRLRVELEERARQQAKALSFAIQGAVATKLREKEEEIQRLAKLNWGLQERVRSLCAENQLWRGLAQSNEAAANSLRTDLERVLSGTTGGAGVNIIPPAAAAAAERPGDEGEEDAESCCGSNEEEEEEVGGRRSGRRRCKGCKVGWLEETSSEGVVVMPCRHVLTEECERCRQGGPCNESEKLYYEVYADLVKSYVYVELEKLLDGKDYYSNFIVIHVRKLTS